MYVNAQTIVLAGSVLGALIAFGTLFWKLFKWINHQKEQDEEIKKVKRMVKDLHATHDNDTLSIQEEQTLIVYGLLACLKGLSEQGCDGPVSEAIGKIEKHLNQKAHCRKEFTNDNND